MLFLCHRVPYPPNKGDKIRSFHEIRHFSKNHEVHLLAFCDDPDGQACGGELGALCSSVTIIPIRPRRQRLNAAISMLRGEPWTLGYYADRRMWRAVGEKAASLPFDIVFVYSSSMAPYAAGCADTPKVLDFVDSDASKWRQYVALKPVVSKWLYAYESGRLSRFENSMVQAFDRSVFVSSRETRHLEDPDGRIVFIQNGIEISEEAPIRQQSFPPRLVFVGAMDYFPNVDAVCYFSREILPRVRKKREVEFLVVGSRPTPEVRSLNRMSGIRVTGTVDDVEPYLREAAVAVVPTRIAQGIQNKILEALAAGLPVVTTRAAAGGLKTIEGIPVAAADDPDAFAEKVVYFLDNPLTAEQIRGCRDHLRLHYSWETNLSVFDRIFDELRARSRSGAHESRK